MKYNKQSKYSHHSAHYMRSAASVFVSVALVATIAGAQAAPHALEEVIVTAQKRSESLQDTPIAVSVMSGADMKATMTESPEDLQYNIPNFNYGGYLGQARAMIRGVGLESQGVGEEGNVAFHVDGVYMSRPSGTGAYLDIARVEVLRGPQGTLYGRNSTGGSINLISNKPTDEFEADISVLTANYNRVSAEGAISGPITDKIRGRVAFKTDDRDGYTENTVTGTDLDDASTRSIRGSLDFDLTSNLSALFVMDYHNEDDNNYAYHFFGNGAADGSAPAGIEKFGGATSPDPRNVSHDADTTNDRTIWGTSLTLNWDLSDSLSLRSITAYRNSDYTVSSDIDATDVHLGILTQEEESNALSEELQLTGGSERSNWLVGLYYYQDEFDGGISAPKGPLYRAYENPSNGLQTVGDFSVSGVEDVESYALFGQYSLNISSNWSTTLGLRYSYEKKSISDGFVYDSNDFDISMSRQDEENWDAVTPKVSLEYRFDNDTLLYGSVSRGFKSGTFNFGSPGSEPIDPEFNTSFEVGVKGDYIDGRLRSNLAAFFYDYTDLQVAKVEGSVLVIENAADATIFGFEAELDAIITDNLTLSLALGFLDATYDTFESQDPTNPGASEALDLSGNSLTQAPRGTANLGAQYNWTSKLGDFNLRGEVFWSDDYYLDAFNRDVSKAEAHSRTNAFLNYEGLDGKWYGTLFVRNITDEDNVTSGFVAAGTYGFPVQTVLESPRTYGVKVGYRF